MSFRISVPLRNLTASPLAKSASAGLSRTKNAALQFLLSGFFSFRVRRGRNSCRCSAIKESSLSAVTKAAARSRVSGSGRRGLSESVWRRIASSLVATLLVDLSEVVGCFGVLAEFPCSRRVALGFFRIALAEPYPTERVPVIPQCRCQIQLTAINEIERDITE
jgi:hypothetical protein